MCRRGRGRTSRERELIRERNIGRELRAPVSFEFVDLGLHFREYGGERSPATFIVQN